MYLYNGSLFQDEISDADTMSVGVGGASPSSLVAIDEELSAPATAYMEKVVGESPDSPVLIDEKPSLPPIVILDDELQTPKNVITEGPRSPDIIYISDDDDDFPPVSQVAATLITLALPMNSYGNFLHWNLSIFV